MAKTKISEFSPTPANNTDIDNINIAEGCAPSGINDAIRELMAQLKDFQAGTAGDSFNGPIGSTTAVTGAFTNITASGTLGVTGVATLGNGAVLGTPTSVTLTNATGLPIATGVSGLGTGVATALAVNVGSAGAPVVNNGALGTPSSGTVTNLTGTASININGTVGATTATTGAFTTLAASSDVTLSGGTANGVAYLNGSKALTTGSALTFDGTNLGLGTASPSGASGTTFAINGGAGQTRLALKNNGSGDASSDGFQIALLSDGVNVVYQNRESGYQAWEGDGSELMRLTSTGLGIGTSSPGLKVDIAGGGNALRIRTDGSGIGKIQFTDSAVTEDYAYIGTPAANALAFWVGGNSEQMRLTSTGLGIGTSSPTAKLDVFGLSQLNTGTYAAGYALSFAANSETSRKYQMGMVTGGNFAIYDSAAAETRLTLDSSGNLGLGVTPSAWDTYKSFELGQYGYISSGAGGWMDLMMNTYYGSGAYRYKGTGQASHYLQQDGIHAWFSAPSGTAGNVIAFTQAMTLDASGNLLVGTTSFSYNPTQGATIAGGSLGSIGIGHATGTGSGNGYLNFTYGGTNIGSVSQNGTTAVSYNTTSDYRLKINVKPLTGALALVQALKPSKFTWVDGREDDGFIAHELQEVLPNVVTGEKDAVYKDGNPKYQQVDYSRIVATLTAAIQELKAEFDAYKASHP